MNDDANWSKFQSAPPVRAATQVQLDNGDWEDVSIRTAREGGDIC